MDKKLTLKDVADNMKTFRKRNGYSQKYVANMLSISRTLYNMIENAKRPAKIQNAELLANLYHEDKSLFIATDKTDNYNKDYQRGYYDGFRMNVIPEIDIECEQENDGTFEYICENLDMNFGLAILLSEMGFHIEYFDKWVENHGEPFASCKEMRCGVMQDKYIRAIHSEFFNNYDYSIQKGYSTKRAYFAREDSLNLQREILGFINYKIKEYIKNSKNLYDDSITTDSQPI